MVKREVWTANEAEIAIFIEDGFGNYIVPAILETSFAQNVSFTESITTKEDGQPGASAKDISTEVGTYEINIREFYYRKSTQIDSFLDHSSTFRIAIALNNDRYSGVAPFENDVHIFRSARCVSWEPQWEVNGLAAVTMTFRAEEMDPLNDTPSEDTMVRHASTHYLAGNDPLNITALGAAPVAHSHDAAAIISGTFALDRIPATLTGKNADMLDGLHSSAFAMYAHNHDTIYAPIIHTHTGVYAPIVHTHTGVYAPVTHYHSAADLTSGTLPLDRLPSDLTGKNADSVDGYHATAFALSGHNHSGTYAPYVHAFRHLPGGSDSVFPAAPVSKKALFYDPASASFVWDLAISGTHAVNHAVSGGDTVFPAAPATKKALFYDPGTGLLWDTAWPSVPAHATSHSSGGSDPITVSNLAGNLNQSRTHGSPDTDESTSALHHTIGTGSNQAAAGNHNHSSVYSPATHATQHAVGAGDTIFPSAPVSKLALFYSPGVGLVWDASGSDVALHASTHSANGSDPVSLANLYGNLTQSRSHDSADTDSGTGSLHHTIGTGSNQAAAGNHTHAVGAHSHYKLDITDLSNLGWDNTNKMLTVGPTTYINPWGYNTVAAFGNAQSSVVQISTEDTDCSAGLVFTSLGMHTWAFMSRPAEDDYRLDIVATSGEVHCASFVPQDGYYAYFGLGTDAPDAMFHIHGKTSMQESIGTGLWRLTTWNCDCKLESGFNYDYQNVGLVNSWIQSSTSVGTVMPLLLNPAGGSVGIGTAYPLSKLHVNSTSSIHETIGSGMWLITAENLRLEAGFRFNWSNDYVYNAWIQASDLSNNVMPLVLNPGGGFVGIHTTNPLLPTQWGSAGGVQFTNGGEIKITYNMYYGDSADRYLDASTKASQIVLDSGGAIRFYNTNTASSSSYSAVTGLTQRVTILSTGEIGMGCTSPVGTLQLTKYAGADTIGGALVIDRNATTGGSGNYRGGAIFPYYFNNNVANHKEHLVFTVTEDNSPLDISKAKMVIGADGRVGIGITAPNCKLRVYDPTSSGYSNTIAHFGGKGPWSDGDYEGIQIGFSDIRSQYKNTGYWNLVFVVGDSGTDKYEILRLAPGLCAIGTSSAIDSALLSAEASSKPAAAFKTSYDSSYAVWVRNTHTDGSGMIIYAGSDQNDSILALYNNGASANRFTIAGNGHMYQECDKTDWCQTIYQKNTSGYGPYIKTWATTSATSAFRVDNQNGLLFVIDSNGDTRVGNLAGSGNRAVYSDSNGYLTNSSSDIRLKKNISSIKDALGLVQSLRGVSYNWDTSKERVKRFGSHLEYGFIAQEIEKVIPDLAYDNADGTKGVRKDNVSPILVEAVKELAVRIEALEKGLAK